MQTMKQQPISKNITTILVYGRPPLVFLGMLCTIAVMWNRNPALYALGLLFLSTSMTFDLIDGWFAARFIPNSTLAHLADRIMDKIVYSIIFPLIAVGMMWRLLYIAHGFSRPELLHAIFVMLLCVIVLIRDNFAHFMRGFAIRKDQEPELRELTRIRTIVAAPLGALLYAYAFYIPVETPSAIYEYFSWPGSFPLRDLFIIEILFLIINLGSIAGYCRRYGAICLDELCMDNEVLRRRILSVFPNALTVMNAMMGLLAVFFAYQGRVREAYLILIGATVFDKLDGALARKLGLADSVPATGSPKISLGGVMDDVADAVSFCIAPAWIFYISLSDISIFPLNPVLLFVIAITYTAAGISRLVYFTIDKHPIPGFFKGMPTPAAALFVAAPLIIFAQHASVGSPWTSILGYFCIFIMLLAAVIMNLYPLKYLHIGRFMDRQPWFGRINLLLILVFVFTPYFGFLVFTQLLLYVLSPLITWRIDPEVAAKERRDML